MYRQVPHSPVVYCLVSLITYSDQLDVFKYTKGIKSFQLNKFNSTEGSSPKPPKTIEWL
jgi:hypothetical protein